MNDDMRQLAREQLLRLLEDEPIINDARSLVEQEVLLASIAISLKRIATAADYFQLIMEEGHWPK